MRKVKNNMKNLMLIAGTRPNFVKLAPIVDAIQQDFDYTIIHTGQHYNKEMSDSFFDELSIPDPDINFNINHAFPMRLICKIMDRLELVCYKEKPDCIVVIGDVSSTFAAAVVASQMKIPLAHIEAGERSFDRTMPEELNRVTIDHLSDFLFCTNNIADANLHNENISIDRRFVVGNTLIDSLTKWLPHIESHSNGTQPFVMFTLHRESNVDNKETLTEILKAIQIIGNMIPIKFPIHPRTKQRILDFDLGHYLDNTEVLDPMGYCEFLQNVNNAKLLLTDSGGAQIEASFLGTKCITLRDNTEHICTLQQGCNMLAGTQSIHILEAFELMMNVKPTKHCDSLWDGKASQRIVDILKDQLL